MSEQVLMQAKAVQLPGRSVAGGHHDTPLLQQCLKDTCSGTMGWPVAPPRPAAFQG